MGSKCGGVFALRGVNLLLHDGYGPECLAGVMAHISHSTPSSAAHVAARAGVGRLILVHRHPVEAWSFSADLEAAREIFPATELGVDGMAVEF
jgi:ribonuclease Z